MRILVTGSTGFIGRRLLALLRQRADASSLVCLARPSIEPGEIAAAAEAERAGIVMITADLMNPRVADVVPPPVDIVFHLAANIDTGGSAEEHRVNVDGTAHLIGWLGDRLRGGRIIYTSAVAAVDRAGPTHGPINESTPCVPRTAYGAAKLRGEAVVQACAETAGYAWTIVRLPTVYGPGQKSGGMFDLLRAQSARGSLIGRLDWPGKTSVIHVDDATRVLWDLAVQADTANEVYCVASDDSLTVGEIGRSIARATGIRVRPICPPAWAWTTARRLVWSPILPALVPRSMRVTYWRASLIVDDGFWFDTTKLRRVYHGRFRTLEEGLTDTFERQAERPSGVDTSAPTNRGPVPVAFGIMRMLQRAAIALTHAISQIIDWLSV